MTGVEFVGSVSWGIGGLIIGGIGAWMATAVAYEGRMQRLLLDCNRTIDTMRQSLISRMAGQCYRKRKLERRKRSSRCRRKYREVKAKQGDKGNARDVT